MTGMNDSMKGSKNILVVDDDDVMRQAAVLMLQQLGYNVSEEEDGPSALKVLGQDGKGIDLVFSDVLMPPGMNGFELAQELRRRYPHNNVRLTSDIPRSHFNEDGADGIWFVLRMADLVEAVRTALDK